MADIRTIPVPVEVADRINQIALHLHDIADELSDFATIYMQLDDVLLKETLSSSQKGDIDNPRWTEEEIDLATKLHKEGCSYNEIALALVGEGYPFRSVASVRSFIIARMK